MNKDQGIFDDDQSGNNREQVVIKRHNSKTSLASILLFVLVVLIMAFIFFTWNPFGGDAVDTDVNVPSPTSDLVPQPQ